MKKRSGQQLTEFAVIGAVILGICVISVVFFSDSIVAMLKDNPVLSMFQGNRTTNQENPEDLLSNVSVSLNGQSFNAPVESVIKQKLLDGTYQQTSGSSGNIDETVEIMQAYISQLKALLNSWGDTSSEAYTAVTTAINELESAVNNYTALDQQYASNSNKRLANQLNITTDLAQNGELASNLADALESAKDDASFKALNSQTQKMIETYSNDLLSFGQSLEYKIDSRLVSAKNLKSEETGKSAVNSSISSIKDYIDSSSLSRPTEKRLNSVLNDITRAMNSEKLSSSRKDRLITRIENLQADLSPGQRDLKDLLGSLKTNFGNYSKTSQASRLATSLLEGSLNLTTEELKKINVYREGNYTEIAPDSYNNKVLCESSGGSVSDGACSY